MAPKPPLRTGGRPGGRPGVHMPSADQVPVRCPVPAGPACLAAGAASPGAILPGHERAGGLCAQCLRTAASRLQPDKLPLIGGVQDTQHGIKAMQCALH